MIRSLIIALVVTVSPAVPLHAAGETITLDLPSLPEGKKLTLEYDTTVQALGGDTSDLSTKATITAAGGILVETDDPDSAAMPPDDPTLTPVFDNTPPAGVDAIEVLAGGDIRIGFDATPGAGYRIEYSHNLVTWEPVVPIIIATGNRVQWTDEGPPATVSHPSAVLKRFYRVASVMAPGGGDGSPGASPALPP